MTQFLTDSFTGTAGTLLSAHTSDTGNTWTQIAGWSGQTIPSTGQIDATGTALIGTTAGAVSTSQVLYKSNAVPGSADYSNEGDFYIYSVPNDFVGLSIRMASAATTIGGYAAIFNGTYIQLWNLTALTTLASSVAFVATVGETYHLKIIATGTAIAASLSRLSDGFYLNTAGTFVTGSRSFSSATDSAIVAAGVPAILIRGNASTGVKLDNIASIDSTAAATATTLTGPTSGVNGVASTNFTVGANGGISGTVIVTPSDSSGGGTFTPTTISISVGSPTGTFTYTPASGGTKTISTTNNGGLSNPATIGYVVSSPVTIPVTDTNVYFSPYNWYSDGAGAMGSNNAHASSTYALANMRGAYLKTKFTVGASGYIKLNVSTSMIASMANQAGAPTIAWSINNGVIQTHLLATTDTQITLATGLSAATYDVKLWFQGVYITQDGSTTENYTNLYNVVKITGFELSTNGSSLAPTIKPKNIVCFGDSITEGDINMSGTRSASSQDATQVWSVYLADALNAEVGVIGFHGANWSWFDGSWPNYASGKSRLVSGLLSPAPDYIVGNYGHNDGNPGPATASVNSTLAAIKTAAPNAKIVLTVPFTGYARTNISAATLPISGTLIDIALPQNAYQAAASIWSYDGVHPDARSHANIGASLAYAINNATFTATARTITLTLVNVSNSTQNSLTGLKWAFWEGITPDLLTAPVSKGSAGSTNSSGVIVLSVNTLLASGGIGWLVVTNSDGTTTQSPVEKCFSGPVTVV
jgi:lysophospholipase L1-like esterase